MASGKLQFLTHPSTVNGETLLLSILDLIPGFIIIDLESDPPAGGNGIRKSHLLLLLIGNQERLDHLGNLTRPVVILGVLVSALSGIQHIVVSGLLDLIHGEIVTLKIDYRLTVLLHDRGPAEDLALVRVHLRDLTLPGDIDGLPNTARHLSILVGTGFLRGIAVFAPVTRSL